MAALHISRELNKNSIIIRTENLLYVPLFISILLRAIAIDMNTYHLPGVGVIIRCTYEYNMQLIQENPKKKLFRGGYDWALPMIRKR